MNLFTQAVIGGLMTGAVYTLLGIGLVLVYRTARILNLAHGETFAITGVTAALLTAAGQPLWVALGGATLAALAFATGLYRFVLRPRGDSPLASLILITLGAAFVARGVMVLLVGADPVSFPDVFAGAPLRFLGGAMPRQGLALVVVGFGASAGISVFLTRTRPGKELLATAENPYAAELLGVNVERARLVAFALSGLLGAIAGILLIPLIAVDFQSGLAMTLRGFIAAAISGMSPVAVIGSGLVLGLFEAMIGAYIGPLFQDPVMFFILILVALWRSRAVRFGGAARA
jgi:branched-chain amino acid transport system permease protein